MSSEKKILITGGAGFVGSYLVKVFSSQKTKFCIYDIKKPSFDLFQGEFIKGDMLDLRSLKETVKKHDAVVHLVGLADLGIAQERPLESFKINLLSLQNLLEACRVSGGGKIIFPSSAAVYGLTEDLPIKENSPLNPTTVYAWHKLICEKLILSYHQNYQLEYAILRLFNVYGSGNKGVIDIFVDKAKKRQVIKSFGPYQYRDFVYAGDVAEALYKAAISDKASNRVVNIGSGKGIQIREILDLICEIFPGAKWIEEKEKFTMYDSIADITLAKILLDFKPQDTREFMKKVILEEMV